MKEVLTVLELPFTKVLRTQPEARMEYLKLLQPDAFNRIMGAVLVAVNTSKGHNAAIEAAQDILHDELKELRTPYVHKVAVTMGVIIGSLMGYRDGVEDKYIAAVATTGHETIDVNIYMPEYEHLEWAVFKVEVFKETGAVR